MYLLLSLDTNAFLVLKYEIICINSNLEDRDHCTKNIIKRLHGKESLS